jgi:TRAP-type C4-dicarboxylate transport system permease small subunit
MKEKVGTMHNITIYVDFIIRLFEKYVGIFLLSSLFFLLTLEVITRYFFRSPLSWPEELTRFCFVGLIYLSISYAASEDAHIRIAMHLDLLPRLWKIVFLTIADVLWVFYNIIVIVYGIRTVMNLFRFPYKSPALNFNMAYLYMIIPISFSFMTVRVFQHAYKRLSRIKSYNKKKDAVS